MGARVGAVGPTRGFSLPSTERPYSKYCCNDVGYCAGFVGNRKRTFSAASRTKRNSSVHATTEIACRACERVLALTGAADGGIARTSELKVDELSRRIAGSHEA